MRLLILACFLAFVCTGCFKPKLKRFVYCSEAAPSTFNPQLASDGASFDASSQAIYNRLVAFKPGTTEVVPSLAESWRLEQGGRRLRFFLRKDVAFHSTDYFKPSRKFNADDVIFSFNRMSDPNHPFHSIGGGDYRYYKSMEMGRVVEDLVKVSEYEIVFKLKKPEAAFLANMAMDFASVLSKEYGDYLERTDQKELMDFKPIGTGPFQLEYYKENRAIHYLAHKTYFEGRPKIEKLKFRILPETAQRFNAFLKGKCDFIKNPPANEISFLMEAKDFKVVSTPALNVSYLAMNLKLKKLKNKHFRRSISYALNRPKYIREIYKGYADLAKSPLPRGIWAFDPSLKPIQYNLEKAKFYLKKSGLKTPIDLELWTLPVSRPYNPNGRRMGELIKKDLAELGVEVRLVTYDWPTYLDKISKAEHEMVLYGWTGDNGDPDNFLNTLLSCAAAEGGNNVAQFCNLEYEKQIQAARRAQTVKKRKLFYKKALNVFREELPWVPIAHSQVFKVMKSNVEGYQSSPIGTESFYNVHLKDWSGYEK